MVQVDVGMPWDDDHSVQLPLSSVEGKGASGRMYSGSVHFSIAPARLPMYATSPLFSTNQENNQSCRCIIFNGDSK
jgi:hypothetical protein